jgi:flagellar motility protein MotE (MotC chaperone)
MKQQPYASSLPPSRLCRILLLALALKLTVLGVMLCDPLVSGFWNKITGADVNAALAADPTPAAAKPLPPIVQSASAPSLNSGGLPDVGMRAAPGSSPNAGTPAAVPGITAYLAGAAPPEETSQRALPLLRKENATDAAAQAPDIARDSLTRKQGELARREQELRSLESELSGKIEQMQLLENRIQTMIKDAEDLRDAKFRHLVDVLANMKGKQAAATLETMDQRVAVKLLAGMRGRQAGEILTYVKPEIAALLTESLARMQLPLE